MPEVAAPAIAPLPEVPLSDLIAYIYLSRAVEPLAMPRLSEWGRHFGPRNKEREVTGVLLTVGDHFVQLLEGRRSTVLALADTIKQDPRHEDFRVLAVRPIRERSFGRWAMRLMRLEDRLYLGLAEVAALRAAVRQLVGNQDPPKEAFIELLQALPATLKRNKIDAESVASPVLPG